MVSAASLVSDLKAWLLRAEQRSPVGQKFAHVARSTAERVRPHRMIRTVLGFAHDAETCGDELAADVYVACDVIALSAARALQRAHGGRLVADVREVPDLGQRSLPKAVSPIDLDLLNAAHLQMLTDADHCLCVGPTLATRLVDLGIESTVVPNYLDHEPPQDGDQLHQMLDIDPARRLIAVPNTVVAGAESLVEAMPSLPADVDLVFIGNTKPADYRERLAEAAEQAGVGDRVHWVQPVPYEEFRHVLGSADVGVIILDPSIANHRVAYPNRLFDVLSAELVVATTSTKDIDAVVEGFGCGVIIPENTTAAWTEGLQLALVEQATLAAGSACAARTLTWSSVEKDLLTALGVDEGDSVTFLHQKNLHRNQRTRRMAATLTRHGVQCRIGTRVTGEASGLGELQLVDLDERSPRTRSITPPRRDA